MLCGLAMLLNSAPAHAAKRLAVLELSGELPPQELGLLTDAVRGAVVDTVGARIQVMTRENMEVMLTDMGIDASCIAEGACEVETARNLGVGYVVSGAVVAMGGKQIASLKLHQTDNGQLLSSKRAQGADALGLLDTIGETAGQLMEALVAPSDDRVSTPATVPPKPTASAPGPALYCGGRKVNDYVATFQEAYQLGQQIDLKPHPAANFAKRVLEIDIGRRAFNSVESLVDIQQKDDIKATIRLKCTMR